VLGSGGGTEREHGERDEQRQRRAQDGGRAGSGAESRRVAGLKLDRRHRPPRGMGETRYQRGDECYCRDDPGTTAEYKDVDDKKAI